MEEKALLNTVVTCLPPHETALENSEMSHDSLHESLSQTHCGESGEIGEDRSDPVSFRRISQDLLPHP